MNIKSAAGRQAAIGSSAQPLAPLLMEIRRRCWSTGCILQRTSQHQDQACPNWKASPNAACIPRFLCTLILISYLACYASSALKMVWRGDRPLSRALLAA